MKQRYEGEWPDTFPYKAKALFAFEDFNGVDVCFFGMHVQEYGSDAPAPNSRRVYIAYLDSVHFFKPKQYRTAVYHEILLGYLQYAKMNNYAMAHIWACPPSEGDDYIFHCHPPEQKIPKPKRLQDWYKNMLNTGIQEKIVVSYQDILKQAQQDQVKSAMDLPYFEGDFWPNVIEDSIKEIEMEQDKQQQQNQMNDSGNDMSGNNGTDDDSLGKFLSANRELLLSSVLDLQTRVKETRNRTRETVALLTPAHVAKRTKRSLVQTKNPIRNRTSAKTTFRGTSQEPVRSSGSQHSVSRNSGNRN